MLVVTNTHTPFMKKTPVLLIAIGLLFACGPSEEEMAMREKSKNDSLFAAAKEQVRLEEQRAAQLAQLKQQLIDLTALLAGEQARLESIRDFQFLRSSSEKARQIAEQTRVVEELKLQLRELKDTLGEIEQADTN